MDDEAVECTSADGLWLEAVVSEPDAARRAFLLCHPHPQMGGTMNAPLLLALRDRLLADGWAVFRFNFRGIGESEGESSDGIPEVADAAGAIAAARRRWPGLPLAIGGWSFGGAVAIRAAMADDDLAACAVVAPAVSPKPGITAGVPSPGEVKLSCPLLVVGAANDRQVEPAAVKGWAETVEGAGYVEIAGANHFFWAKYDRLSSVFGDWLAEAVPAPDRGAT